MDIFNVSDGLSEEEVVNSRERFGSNRISRQKRKSFLESFLESFGDPMIKILLVALAVNVIFMFNNANWFETIGIAVAILLATFVSTLSEYGSESAFEKLQDEASKISCKVRRNGKIEEVPIDMIVVGDLVYLQPGDKIPADGLIIRGRIEVDQSALNGESKETLKYPHQSLKNSSFWDPSRLFSGTVVCSGEAFMRVMDVGDRTVYGALGAEIQGETRESPLKLRLGKLAEGIGKFSYLAAFIAAIAYLFNVIVLDNGSDPQRILNTLKTYDLMFSYLIKAATLGVTVIVMAVPEGLPMMITVVLSANMKKMLRDNVLVRKLTGIETAGSLNILFTDKTGTLTHGKLDVTHFVTGSGGILSRKEIESAHEKLRSVLNDSIKYNCSASMSGKTAIGGNSTDRAALEFVSGLKAANRDIRKTGESIPFSSDTKFMATTVAGDRNLTFIKGAPEKILPFCTGFYDEKGEMKTDFNRRAIESAIKELAEKAVRTVAIAVSQTPVGKDGRFRGLKLIGILGIRDRIRREAVEGIKLVQSAGIQTVMITGDARATAQAIARETGLIRRPADIVITSDEMKAMSDAELIRILPNLKVVARALPSDKSRLVKIAQSNGLVVGMTGDGVNDAPALKKADIGFAMGSGAEIAKEAGDIVILDDNFNSIAKAVCYGRAIFKSIRKFIIYQISICMCAMGVTVIAPLIGVDFPITVIQMLWINIVMDTLAGLAFSGEAARKKYMEEPPKKRDEPIINSYMKGQIASTSVFSTALCLFFLRSRRVFETFGGRGEIYMMTAFFALFMFLAILISFCARTHKLNLFDHLSSNKPFLLIMGLVTVIQIFILYYGGRVFRTSGLEFNHLLTVAALAFTIIPFDALRKYLLSKTAGYSGT